MTNPSNAPIPAGWYPDPAGGPRSRWWDGTQWTETFQEPYSAATGTALKAPEGTKAYNVWIWLVVLLPYISLPFLFAIDFSSLVDPRVLSDPDAALEAQFAFYLNPWIWVSTILGWAASAFTIFFAYRDWKSLLASGVPQPFHWAFAFLNLAVGPVYAIGRAVVVKRRTGHGSAVLWVTIGMIVLSIVVVIGWTAALVSQIVQAASTMR